MALLDLQGMDLPEISGGHSSHSKSCGGAVSQHPEPAALLEKRMTSVPGGGLYPGRHPGLLNHRVCAVQGAVTAEREDL